MHVCVNMFMHAYKIHGSSVLHLREAFMEESRYPLLTGVE